jgi:hypothetical protein
MTGTVHRFTDEDILAGRVRALETINYSPEKHLNVFIQPTEVSDRSGRVGLADRSPIARQVHEIIRQFNSSVDKIQSRSQSPITRSPPQEPVQPSTNHLATTIRRYIVVDGQKKELTEEEYSDILSRSRLPLQNGSPDLTKHMDRSPVSSPFGQNSDIPIKSDLQTSNWMASQSPETRGDQKSEEGRSNGKNTDFSPKAVEQKSPTKKDAIDERNKEKEERRSERLRKLHGGEASNKKREANGGKRSKEKTGQRQGLECIEAPDYTWLNEHRRVVEERQQCRKYRASLERRGGSRDLLGQAESGRWMEQVQQKKASQGVVGEVPSFFIQPVYRQLDKELKNHVKQAQATKSRATAKKPKPLKFTS